MNVTGHHSFRVLWSADFTFVARRGPGWDSSGSPTRLASDRLGFRIWPGPPHLLLSLLRRTDQAHRTFPTYVDQLIATLWLVSFDWQICSEIAVVNPLHQPSSQVVINHHLVQPGLDLCSYQLHSILTPNLTRLARSLHHWWQARSDSPLLRPPPSSPPLVVQSFVRVYSFDLDFVLGRFIKIKAACSSDSAPGVNYYCVKARTAQSAKTVCWSQKLPDRGRSLRTWSADTRLETRHLELFSSWFSEAGRFCNSR